MQHQPQPLHGVPCFGLRLKASRESKSTPLPFACVAILSRYNGRSIRKSVQNDLINQKVFQTDCAFGRFCGLAERSIRTRHGGGLDNVLVGHQLRVADSLDEAKAAFRAALRTRYSPPSRRLSVRWRRDAARSSRCRYLSACPGAEDCPRPDVSRPTLGSDVWDSWDTNPNCRERVG
jgi:hypothetical protein